MITFRSLKEERPEMSDLDILAFLNFARNFECLDSDSFEEAHEKICASMENISDEMEALDFDDAEGQREILRERYKNL